MSEQEQYIQERERQLREHGEQKRPAKQTLEVVELERQGVPLPVWQQWIVNILAVIGGITIIYVILNWIGVF